MTDPPSTRPSLLLRLRDGQDAEAWHQFVELYAPLIYRFARRHRLQDADAADVTQDVLQAVNTAMDRLAYDAQRGSFRGWLFTLAHHKLCDFLTRRQRQCRGSGDSDMQQRLQELPAPEQDQWNQDYERRLFVWAAEQAQKHFTRETWQAFWQTAVDGLDPGAVAAALGTSIGSVYIAKSRVQARLKQLIQAARRD